MSELNCLKGVGEKRLKCLENEGIFTINQLLNFFPKRYKVYEFINCYEKFHQCCAAVVLKVVSIPSFFRKGKTSYTKVKLQIGDKNVYAMWFNNFFVKSKLVLNSEFVFYGLISEKNGVFTFVNPKFEKYVDGNKIITIEPYYEKIEGFNNKLISKLVMQAMQKNTIVSAINQDFLNEYNLMSLKESYFQIHNPLSFESAKSASQRIAIEQMAIKIKSNKVILKNGNKATKYKNIDIITTVNSILPFELSSSQKLAIEDIVSDLKSKNTMNRLLLGDVGAGKTAVALAGVVFAVKSGYQCCLICPTESLANQHFAFFSEVLKKINLNASILTSSTKNKNDVIERLSSGKINLIIGTHSILSDNVTFKNLKLCVIDEQHKFGVSERAKLMNKGLDIEVLTLSATPIPRTLLLAIYGDLSLTILKREQSKFCVNTRIILEDKLAGCFEFVRKRINSGGQAYFICSKVDSDGDDYNIEKVSELIKSSPLKDVSYATLYGGMAASEKAKVFNSFISGATKLLIATSIVEVGIDAKLADTMLIFSPQYFGLAGLHQLRGRIGRSGQDSWCFLLGDDLNENSYNRLDYFKGCNDGFLIAEYDYNNRGAGDYMGQRQHGKSSGMLECNISKEVIEMATKAAYCIDEKIYDSAISLQSNTLIEDFVLN